MTTFAAGAFKVLTINEEVTFNTLVAAGGQSLERVESTVDLTKDVYKSNAIRSDRQKAISRHGMRKVGGNIKGELNPGAMTRIMQAILARDFATGATTTAQTTISATATTFHRSAGSFLTNGFKVGRVVASTGWSTGGSTANNSKRVLLTGVTASDLTFVKMDGTAPGFTVAASGDTVTIAEVGKTTYVPASGHTDKSFSIEHNFSDIVQSEQFTGCKFSSMDINLPTTGLSTIDVAVMGKDLTRGTASAFTSPSAAASGAGLSSVNGLLTIGGTPVAILNSMQFKVDAQMAVDGVVGSNTTPFVWAGPIVGSGQFTAFFQDATFRDYFVDETEIGLTVLLTTNNTNTADFLAFTMPRVKVNGATKDDKETGGMKLSGAFEFLRNTSGGSGTTSDDTTIVVQDSLAP